LNSPSPKALTAIAAGLYVFWGLVPSASKTVIEEIPVELYIALRWTISGLIFFIWIYIQRAHEGILKRQSLWVSLLGIGGYAVASMGSLYGLKIGGVAHFAFVGALNPVLTAAVAILVLRERPRIHFVISLLVCVVGLLVFVQGKHQISTFEVAVFSSVLILGAGVLEAIIFVFSKKLKYHFTSVQYLAIGQLSAAGFMWVLQLLAFGQVDRIQNLSGRGWGAVLFVSVVSCVLCFSVLFWLLNYIDGHRLALFHGLHTVSAALFGFVFFNEKFDGLMWIGGLILLFGLVMGHHSSRSAKV